MLARLIGQWMQGNVAAIWIAVALLFALSSLLAPAMFQLSQVVNILQVAAFLGVIAIGQTFVVLTGGIDLSQAGLVTLTNIVSTSLMGGTADNILLAITVSLLLAAGVGAANGFLVAIVAITPLIATLGMNAILFGGALVFTGGAPHGSAAPEFQPIGTGYLFGLPASTLVWAGLAIFAFILTRRTIFGRWLYAVGANAQAATMMGIPVAGVRMLAYVLSAVLASLGGLLLTAYIGAPSLGIGNQFLLTSVAAVVVGGTSLSGGIGSVLSTVGGTIFIAELSSFTNIVRVSTGTQFVIQGVLIILSVLAYRALTAAHS
jgi:ribose transport system permease protein